MKYAQVPLLRIVTVLVLSATIPCAAQQIDSTEPANDGHMLALSAIDNMAGFLRSLDKFSVSADIDQDEVLDDGRKIQLSKTMEIRADLPTSVWAEVTSMYTSRQYFYDGTTFTLYTPNAHYYASIGAPASIPEAIDKAQRKYGIEWPLADLFFWGTDMGGFDAIESAAVLGVDKVDGVSCNHLAFHQADVDWQVCIQRGGIPLPLRIVIITSEEPEQPSFSARLKWDISPTLRGQEFTFMPSESDHEISFAEVTDIHGESTEEGERR